MSKSGINIKIIFIVTSVNKFTVPPLRTLRIPERKTCLPIEKPGGCNLNWILPDTWGQATEFLTAESSGCYYFKSERSGCFSYWPAVPRCAEESTAIWNCCTNNGNWQFEGNLNPLVTIVIIATEVLDFVCGACFGIWEVVSWPCILSQAGTEKFGCQQWNKSFWWWLISHSVLRGVGLEARIYCSTFLWWPEYLSGHQIFKMFSTLGLKICTIHKICHVWMDSLVSDRRRLAVCIKCTIVAD